MKGKWYVRRKKLQKNEIAFISVLTKPGSTLIKGLFHIPERNHRPGRTPLLHSSRVMAWHYQKWRMGIVTFNLCSRGEKRVNYSLSKSDFTNTQSSWKHFEMWNEKQGVLHGVGQFGISFHFERVIAYLSLWGERVSLDNGTSDFLAFREIFSTILSHEGCPSLEDS